MHPTDRPVPPPGRLQEIHYRSGQPVAGHFPGQHRSRRGDSGFEFRGHAPLLDAPDPRRLDLHASLRDPFGQWVVRLHSQRQAMPVVVVADLSASLAFAGQHRKLDLLADFTDSLAWSAWRAGDRFGFIGCAEGLLPEFQQPPTRARGAGQPLADRLRRLVPSGRSSQGLLQAAAQLGRQRALVFLVSDFHLPLDLLQAVLGSLAGHAVVPVVLQEPAEFTLGDRNGLAQVQDPESGRQRLLWWRPALRQRWQRQQHDQHQALLQCFRQHGCAPLCLHGRFDAERVTRHLMG